MVIQLSQDNSLKRLSSHWMAFVHSLMDIYCQSIDWSCQACQKRLAAFMWICLWAFFSISLVCMPGVFLSVCLLAFCLFVCFFVSTVTHCLDSVQFSRSVVSDSLQPHESQHARPPCPSPTAWVHSDSSPLSQWCHPAISSSVVPFSSCPQSPPTSESFPMSQLFAWGGQSTGVSASASFPPKKSQG